MHLSRHGFTLIELIVVIAIISILLSIGFVVYGGIQAKARDSIRKQDLNQLTFALEGYLQKNGKYIDGMGKCTDSENFYILIAPYMASNEVPEDPKTKEKYCYVSVGNGKSYRLFAKLENCQDPDVIAQSLCERGQYNFSKVSLDLVVEPPP